MEQIEQKNGNDLSAPAQVGGKQGGKIQLEKTKKGFPALWEEGGGMSNTGHARIIADSQGQRKKPIFIRTGGHLALGEHALFIVQEGDVVIDIYRHHSDYDITVKRIAKIKTDNEQLIAELETLAHFDQGEWDHEDVARKFNDAIDAAKDKSRCYHCREPHYFTDHPEFRQKMTVNLKDIQSVQTLCSYVDYQLECKLETERRFFFDTDDKQRKISFIYNEDTMDVETLMVVRHLENIGLLEIEKLDKSSFTAIIRLRFVSNRW